MTHGRKILTKGVHYMQDHYSFLLSPQEKANVSSLIQKPIHSEVDRILTKYPIKEISFKDNILHSSTGSGVVYGGHYSRNISLLVRYPSNGGYNNINGSLLSQSQTNLLDSMWINLNHEIGHCVQDLLLKYSFSAEIQKIQSAFERLTKSTAVSQYAMSSSGEFWAETFAATMTNLTLTPNNRIHYNLVLEILQKL